MKYVPTGRHAELFEAILKATKGTGYIAIETPDGFEVEGEETTEEQSSTRREAVTDVIYHTVRLNEKTMRYTVTGGQYQKSTASGVGLGSGGINVGASTEYTYGASIKIGTRDDGTFGIISPLHTRDEGRRIICETAEAHGWTRRTGLGTVWKGVFFALCVLLPLSGVILFFAVLL